MPLVIDDDDPFDMVDKDHPPTQCPMCKSYMGFRWETYAKFGKGDWVCKNCYHTYTLAKAIAKGKWEWK